MNNSTKNTVLSILLWFFGGTLYFFSEVIYKSIAGRPDMISWTMLLLAIFLCIPLERFGAELPWSMPIWLQGIICGTGITLAEFLAGVILNIILKLNIWDYSHVRYNILGQVCLSFYLIWIAASIFGIILFDYIRYAVVGGERPHYHM